MLLDLITLPDLYWQDEYDWTPVVQSMEYSVNGALFIQESTKQTGRILTFVGKDDMWLITRATVDALKAKRDTPGLIMNITLSDSRTFKVRWMNTDAKAIDVSPLIDYNQFNATGYYKINALKFVEVP